METIHYLLKFLFKLAIALIILAFVWWLVTSLYPALSIKNLFHSSDTKDDQGWLPAPGSIGSLLGQARKVPSENDNVYTPGPAYSGYNNAYNNNYGGAKVDFITFTTQGTQIIHGSQAASAPTPTTPSGGTGYENRSLYIRNLSIYQGGSIYTGISFVGEARNTMFKDGKFPIIIVDNQGRVATVAIAEATSVWAVPGWARFSAKITGVMPVKTPCTMVFQSGNIGTSTPVRVALPVTCN